MSAIHPPYAAGVVGILDPPAFGGLPSAGAPADARGAGRQGSIDYAGVAMAANSARPRPGARKVTDVDISLESARLARFNVVVQADTARLAQTIASPQRSLMLLA